MTDHMYEPDPRDEPHPYREDVGRLRSWPSSTYHRELGWLRDQADRFVALLREEGELSDEDVMRKLALPDYADGHRDVYREYDKPQIAQLRLMPFLSTHPDVRRLNVVRVDPAEAPEPGGEAFIEATSRLDLPREDRPVQEGTRSTARFGPWINQAYARAYAVAVEEDRGASVFELNWAARAIGLNNAEIKEVMAHVETLADDLGLTLPADRDEYGLSPLSEYVLEWDRSLTTRLSDEQRDHLRELADAAPPGWEYANADEATGTAEAEAD